MHFFTFVFLIIYLMNNSQRQPASDVKIAYCNDIYTVTGILTSLYLKWYIYIYYNLYIHCHWDPGLIISSWTFLIAVRSLEMCFFVCLFVCLLVWPIVLCSMYMYLHFVFDYRSLVKLFVHFSLFAGLSFGQTK